MKKSITRSLKCPSESSTWEFCDSKSVAFHCSPNDGFQLLPVNLGYSFNYLLNHVNSTFPLATLLLREELFHSSQGERILRESFRGLNENLLDHLMSGWFHSEGGWEREGFSVIAGEGRGIQEPKERIGDKWINGRLRGCRLGFSDGICTSSRVIDKFWLINSLNPSLGQGT